MRTTIVAEIGSNWEGSLTKAKKLIRLTKEAGADAVKFQIWRAKDLYSPKHPHWKNIKKSELNFNKVRKLKEYADKNPEQVKQILGKFIKTGPKAPAPDPATVQGL